MNLNGFYLITYGTCIKANKRYYIREMVKDVERKKTKRAIFCGNYDRRGFNGDWTDVAYGAAIIY